MAGTARVGLVAIGRNEGVRLERCLVSALAQVQNVVYVDSGSSDGSVALARGLGVDVVELEPTLPFTAARARNEGAAWLACKVEQLEFVQFIDGDCELQTGWMDAALRVARAHPATAVVCGRRRERNPGASVYNRLCDIEWDTPVGEAETCGGDALYRWEAFSAVAGFSPTLIAGEEPDLCQRLRRQGWRVERIGDEMTLHDADIKHLGQWWRRNVRSGHASAEALLRNNEREALRRVASNVVWALPPAWGLWPVLWLRAYRSRPDPTWATFIVLGKLPHCQGQVQFWMQRFRRERTSIIEYK